MSAADGIHNEDLYHDRTVQDWHRQAFDRDCWAIDLDLMGVCRSCRQPLYLIESTTNPAKPTSILRNLGERAAVPALVVWHDTHNITGAQQVWPHPLLRKLTEPDLRAYLTWLRVQHGRDAHGRT